MPLNGIFCDIFHTENLICFLLWDRSWCSRKSYNTLIIAIGRGTLEWSVFISTSILTTFNQWLNWTGFGSFWSKPGILCVNELFSTINPLSKSSRCRHSLDCHSFLQSDVKFEINCLPNRLQMSFSKIAYFCCLVWCFQIKLKISDLN